MVTPICGEISDPVESRIVQHIDQHNTQMLEDLETLVNINSGTMNRAGIREVGAFFESEFANLGFDTRWVELPESMERSGHVFAERQGSSGKRVLLIGHLDTVFEPDSPFQEYQQSGNIGAGPGTEDMKGGDLVILYALKALHASGVLDNTQIIVALTGDEEKPGSPVAVTRQELIAAGKRSDIALGFEAGVRDIHTGTVARRGSSGWTLEVKAQPSHSSQIFDDEVGAGAVFETARILHGFYAQIRGENNLTFNPAIVLGGNEVDYNQQTNSGRTSGKTNIVAQMAVVDGDLRFISEEQKERARDQMRKIVSLSLPGAESDITFKDGYPAMSPTKENYDLLARLSQINRDLGYGDIEALPPSARGAADISFVANDVEAAIDGLGPVGWDGHTVDERIDLDTLPIVTKKAALLIYRLTRPEGKASN
jgi:glutamate carboxypeptidase